MTITSWAVIVASGKEEMLNSETCTAFLNLNSRPVLSYSLTAFERCPDIDGVIVTAPREKLEQVVSIVQLFGCHKVKKIVPGGTSQYTSFNNALKYVDEDVDVLLMHEASRPNLYPGNISALVKAARRDGYAILGSEVGDDTATVSGRGTIADEVLEGVTVWTMGAPVAVTSDLLAKSAAAVKRKHKTVRRLSEAVALTGTLPRLVQADVFPMRIKTIDNLQRLDLLGITG